MKAMNLRLEKSNDFYQESLEEALVEIDNKGEWVLRTKTEREIEISVDLQKIYGGDPNWVSLVVFLPVGNLGYEWETSEIHSWAFIREEECQDFWNLPPAQWPSDVREDAEKEARDYLDDFLNRCPDPWGRKAEDFRIFLR